MYTAVLLSLVFTQPLSSISTSLAFLYVRQRGASHPSSFCLSLPHPHPQLVQLRPPCPQHLGDAAVIAVQLQGPAAGSGQLTTRPPSWQCHHLPPLLLQEKPVFQLAPHSAALSSSFPLHHTPLGVAKSCLWGGRLYHPLAASTWMAHPLHHHHRPHPLLLHPHLPLPPLQLQQQLSKSNEYLINFMLCLKCLKTQPVKTHWHGKLAAKLLQSLDCEKSEVYIFICKQCTQCLRQ